MFRHVPPPCEIAPKAIADGGPKPVPHWGLLIGFAAAFARPPETSGLPCIAASTVGDCKLNYKRSRLNAWEGNIRYLRYLLINAQVTRSARCSCKLVGRVPSGSARVHRFQTFIF